AACQYSTAITNGTWTALAHIAPKSISHISLLSDGSVLADSDPDCFRLLPDTNGSYVTGTWTNAASMRDSREYYASQVLQSGKVLVAGGEYGTGGSTSELYDPAYDVWMPVRLPAGLSPLFLDADSVILPNGNVLIAPVAPQNSTVIYDAVANT